MGPHLFDIDLDVADGSTLDGSRALLDKTFDKNDAFIR